MPAALKNLIDPIRAAAAAQAPLCIRGHGSKDFYGEPPQGERLDTTAYTGLVSYEPSELVVTVRAGTPLAELEAALAEKGQCLAFEPPRFTASDGVRQGTCGGMVAAGLSGPARASVGGVRDFVLGVQLINGRGEHLTFGGQVMKNVAGYDVSRLLVGSLGILGVLTEVSLKVLPVPPAEATLVFQLGQDRALAQLHRWGAEPLPLNASCWVRDDTARGTPELLFVRLRGASAAVESACRKMLQDLPGTRMDNTQAGPDWTACRDQHLPFFDPAAHPDTALWRLSLPPTAPVLDLPWPQLVEWHGGQRWLWAPESARVQLRQTAHDAGGSATLFRPAHADGAGTGNRFAALKPPINDIHQRLKAEFDPAGIFNRGRMYPHL
ncbi:glycolate oxidase subunit GlcE [Rhodoferax sp.]|uniref:glycolate oxidase subunit GlcE n=1 Tax=Rhodoferax sp. TaxID=50421 RepID=UPI00260ADE01|nr:glycolate oxidase subunit GlcE [Rhodoferax sp.]MDD2923951.1 glycolate oxidase subunit GlcE [Rhodoferax sp.]